MTDPRTHIFIPDTQAKPGVPMDHLHWIGQYIVDRFWGQDVTIIHAGDHADMPSLSAWDGKGTKEMEGRRYMEDIAAANEAWRVLNQPIVDKNLRMVAQKDRQWWPDRHITLGNHEDRITRAINQDPKFDGLLSLDHLDYAKTGWKVHPYQKIVDIDGVWYSHMFYQPMTGRAYSGTVDNRLRTIGHSFSMGHQQGLLHGIRYVGNQQQHGLIAGSCYQHEEIYKGLQGNWHWRGIVVKHEVRDGAYDPMFVSLNYLSRRYAGVPLAEFTPEMIQPMYSGSSIPSEGAYK